MHLPVLILPSAHSQPNRAEVPPLWLPGYVGRTGMEVGEREGEGEGVGVGKG